MTRPIYFAAMCLFALGCSNEPSYSPTSAREGAAAPQPGGAKPAPAEAPAKSINRIIRYTANVEIVVKNLDATQEAVEALVKSKSGYVAKSELVGQVGDRRSYSWTIKVPVDSFRDAIDAIAKLGTIVRNSSDSEDVTEEFLDLEARLRNMKAEEEVLNKLLKEAAVRIDDVLKIREQIVKNRGEIERAEGRLKYLASVTSFSTIHLMLREIQDYVPPTVPTFGSDITGAFSRSYESLVRFGRNVVLVAVSIAPWLPLLLIGGFLAWKTTQRLQSSPPIAKPRRARLLDADSVPAPENPTQPDSEKPI